MAELKTRPSGRSVAAYLASITPPSKREDAEHLLAMFERVTGYTPVMWGDAIIGFGAYTYSNTAGSYEWLVTGFAPRARNLTVYVMQGFDEFAAEMAELGKVKHAKSCLYINKLSDVDVVKLERLLEKVVADMQKRYACKNISASADLD